MRANAGEQRAGVLAAKQTPRRAALGQHPQPGSHRGQQIRWQRTLVAEEEAQHPVDVFGQRTEEPSPRRAVVKLGAGAFQRAVRHRGGPVRQWVGVRHLGSHQVHPARRQIELGEKRRGHPERVHRRADVVEHAGEFRVGRAAGAAARRRLGLDDPHRQTGSSADDSGSQPVGPAADDGDVHAAIQAHYAGRVSLPVVLIADKLAESTVAALGDQVEVRWVDGPDREKLLAAVPEADALLVRSATTVDAEVLAAAPKLKIVARAGVGLDNVDVDAATARGVLVVNAPTSNIHSAAEHALALLLAAARADPAPPTPRCASTPGSGRRSPAPRSSARPSAWSGWAASASWSRSGWPRSARTSWPTTRTCRRPAPRSSASNC